MDHRHPSMPAASSGTPHTLALGDDTRLLLGQLAETLETRRPRAEMRNEIRLARALVLAEQLHGPTEAAYAAEQDLLAAAPPVTPGQTRSQYAAGLRVLLEESGR